MASVTISVKDNYNKKNVQKGLEDLSLKELRSLAHAKFATANKRIKRIEQAGVISPAYNALVKKRGENPRFTQGGKDLKSLQREVAECYAFLNRETSSVTGARRFERQIENRLGTSAKDAKRVSQLFDLLHAVQERMPEAVFGSAVGSDPTMQAIVEIVNSETEADLSQQELSASQREDIITKAIDKLTNDITKKAHEGDRIIETGLNNFRSLF